MIDVETIARKWANVYELVLPADLEGGYDAANNRILISDRLTPIQRRCVLAHEISHARHHDVGCKCDSATERRADACSSTSSNISPPRLSSTATNVP